MPEHVSLFEQALLSLNRIEARRLVTEAAGRLSSLEIVDSIITPALTQIGERWQRGDAALSQVYMSGRICEELVDELLPSGDPQRKDQPSIAIAVLDDYHMLGKRIVYSVLRANGFDLQDYGRVTVDEVIHHAQADHLQVLLISTLMFPSALHVRDVVMGLRSARVDTKVVVGGAPFLFDSQLWREVGADAMGRSAGEAVNIVNEIVGGMR